MDEWRGVAAAIGPLDDEAMEAARARQGRLSKPAGSLGRLEDLAVRLAGVQGRALARLAERAIVVMAADHGVVAEGVSAYPQAVTAQMVANFLAGGAAINVLARQAGARLVVVDLGVASDSPDVQASRAESLSPSLRGGQLFRRAPIARGTANLAAGPAMTRAQAEAAIAIGLEVVAAEATRGLDAVVLGDMGIGNTTAGAALVAALCEQPPAAVVGRGTGLDDAGWRRKVAVVERALAVNRPDPADPLGVLAAVGGFEHAGLVGVVLGAAARRVLIVVDGLAAAAAALVAVRLCPAAREYLVAGHASVEPGQRAALAALDLRPLLDLDLRLGEGTGGALALHLLDAAVRLHAEMATFDAAGVSEREPS
jgi:nicotinate-nucleotide--dimethylbenzimidazole phosphoribosyltransferase